jgi:hypothetical protein
MLYFSSVVFYTVPIFSFVMIFFACRNLAIFWTLGAFSALIALYGGSVFAELARPSFELSALSAVVITAMTILPLWLVSLLYSISSNGPVTRKQIFIEGQKVAKTLESLYPLVLLLFALCITVSIFTMFRDGIFFRAFYVNAIKTNSGLFLAITYSLGVLTFCISILKRKYLVCFLVVIFLLMLGKKQPVLSVLFLPVIWLVTYSKFKIWKLILTGIFGIALIWVVTKIYADGRGIPLLIQLTSTFDYIINFEYFLEEFPLGSSQGTIFLESFYKYIPRIFWDEKPIVYGFLHIHQYLYPEELASYFTPSTFESYTVWLADFGYWGIIALVLKDSFFLLILLLKQLKPITRFLMLVFMIDLYLFMILVVLLSIQKMWAVFVWKRHPVIPL